MAEIIEQLIEVLGQTERAYRQLLPIIEQEKQAAVGSQVEKLTSLGDEKKTVMARLANLDRRRSALLRQISKQFNIPAAELTISSLADRIMGPQADRLQSLSTSLGELVQKIRIVNEENRQVVQHCLKLIQSALGFLNRWMGPPGVYGASGRMNDRTGNGKILSNAV